MDDSVLMLHSTVIPIGVSLCHSERSEESS